MLRSGLSLLAALCLATVSAADPISTTSSTKAPQETVTNIPQEILVDVDVIDPYTPQTIPTDDIAYLQNAEDEQLRINPDCSGGKIYHPHRNCNMFYQCSNGKAYNFTCPSGLQFNPKLNVCDWPENVNCPNPNDQCIRRRMGGSSGPVDDAVSIATCPRRFVPIECVATNPRGSDGARVSGRNCIVSNSAGNFAGQRAIATCARADGGQYLFPASGRFERNPVARCPYGYRIINCFLRNPWNHEVEDGQQQLRFGAIRPGRGLCYSDVTCDRGQGCYTQAVCRRS